MKGNVIMSRQMGQFNVNQRTKDGMFNASSLILQWNKTENLKKKSIADFFRLAETDDFIGVLIHEENMPIGNSQLGDNQAYLIKKGGNTITGRKPDEVWMHPYLFLKFAMWLNPKFEYHVIKFVYDRLIELRKETSDLYVELCNATNSYHIRNFNREASREHYMNNGTTIQLLVFGKTFPGNPWQNVGESQLKLRKNLQSILIGCFNKNYSMEKTKMLLEAQIEIFKLNEE
jgi:hypothetical protein